MNKKKITIATRQKELLGDHCYEDGIQKDSEAATATRQESIDCWDAPLRRGYDTPPHSCDERLL